MDSLTIDIPGMDRVWEVKFERQNVERYFPGKGDMYGWAYLVTVRAFDDIYRYFYRVEWDVVQQRFADETERDTRVLMELVRHCRRRIDGQIAQLREVQPHQGAHRVTRDFVAYSPVDTRWFSSPPAGDPHRTVEREIEDLLFDVAVHVNQVHEVVEVGTSDELLFDWQGARHWPLLEPELSQGAAYPDLRAFYDAYDELPHTLSRMNGGIVEFKAKAQRVTLLGNSALRALPSPGNKLVHWPVESNVHIRKLDIAAVRCLERLEHHFANSDEKRGQWLVILGANGTGKTSLLRTIAMALLPRNDTTDALLQPFRSAPLVRHDCSEASISVLLHGEELPRTARIGWQQASGHVVHRDRSSAPTPLVVGYGCRRMLGEAGDDAADPRDGCASLFDLPEPLVHVEGWLRREKVRTDEGLYHPAKAVLERVLAVDALDLDESDGRFWVQDQHLGRVPFAALSDGYRTTSAWVLDMIARWATYARNAGIPLTDDFHNDMPCIALVDELDLHLHPQWQSQVVQRLRATFPRTTFIATTHNPLTLTGLQADEILVLEFDEAGKKAVSRQPGTAPGLLTTSEILAMFFNVTRRYLSDSGEVLQRYSFLANNPYRTDDEDSEMLSLQSQLADLGIEPAWQPVERETA